jgi:xanthine dehydrogenase YagS FAD-binding subunit
VADRAAWDFALLSIAAAVKPGSDAVTDARLVCGAAACVPHRLEAAERALIGKGRDETTFANVAKAALEGAEPLQFNQFKIPLLQNLVLRALRSTAT